MFLHFTARRENPSDALTTVFSERFGDGIVAKRYESTAMQGDADDNRTASHYEKNKSAIIAAYKECGGNLSATERVLQSKGIQCNRRWLRIFLVRWGLR